MRNGTKEYTAWKGMRQRCRNPKNPKYHRYGGRGITVCDEWDLFENFLRDMGPAPGGEYSVDRKDNNGNYCKDNCRWATNKVQTNNSSRNRILTYGGIAMSVTQWAEKLKISTHTLNHRVTALGWTIEKAIEKAIGKNGIWALRKKAAA